MVNWCYKLKYWIFESVWLIYHRLSSVFMFYHLPLIFQGYHFDEQQEYFGSQKLSKRELKLNCFRSIWMTNAIQYTSIYVSNIYLPSYTSCNINVNWQLKDIFKTKKRKNKNGNGKIEKKNGNLLVVSSCYNLQSIVVLFFLIFIQLIFYHFPLTIVNSQVQFSRRDSHYTYIQSTIHIW